MTIKIIKEGKTVKFTKTCPDCGCEFEYEKRDVKANYNDVSISYPNEYGTYVICPCCGKHLPHNGYRAYYNKPNVNYVNYIPSEKGQGYINSKYIDGGIIVSYCDNCPNKPDPKYTVTGDSPCDWCIKRQFTYK